MCGALKMKLEDIVCSLEPSKRLKELGVPQESLFYWHCDGSPEGCEYLLRGNETYGRIASAFTSDELGEKLPYRLRLEDDDYWLWQTKLKHGDCEIRYKSCSDILWEKSIQGDSEADARAKMLIHLIEQGIVKVEEL